MVLETTIRGRRLRITRSPAWERPKLRGSGTTTEHAKVVLEEFEHGAWTGLTTRLDEAGDLVSRMLGMNAVQFCQVALLPQGSSPGSCGGADERRKVLERLFATEVFTQVEKWLADRRAATGREAGELSTAAASIADRIAEATGAMPPREQRPAVPPPRRGEPAVEPFAEVAALPAWAAELAGGHADLRVVAEEIRAGATATLGAARAALDGGKASPRGSRATPRPSPGATRWPSTRRRSRRSRPGSTPRNAAGRAAPLVRDVQDRHQRSVQARRWAEEARAQVAGLLPPKAPEDVLAKAERDRRDEAAALEGGRATAARLRDIEREREACRPSCATLSRRTRGSPRPWTNSPASWSRAARHWTRRGSAAARPGAEAAVLDATRRLDAARRRDQVEQSRRGGGGVPRGGRRGAGRPPAGSRPAAGAARRHGGGPCRGTAGR